MTVHPIFASIFEAFGLTPKAEALQPLFPIADADLWCRAHEVEGRPCEHCASAIRDKTDAAYAERLYQMAETTRSYIPSRPLEDREALEQWAKDLERSGSEILGRLMREADREAEDAERERAT